MLTESSSASKMSVLLVWGAAGATHCAAELRRNKQLPLVAFLHQLQSLCPAGDDAIDDEGHRLVAAVGTVELGTLDQRAPVMDGDPVDRSGRRTAAFVHDLVLQVTRQCLRAIPCGIFGKETSLFDAMQLLTIGSRCYG